MQNNDKNEMLSVVMPVYNEQGSLPELLESLFHTLHGIGRDFEILLIDDGSNDQSFEVAARIAQKHPELKVIRFRHNVGQTAALMAGFDFARGQTIVTLDADLQNDPRDIPRLLEKMDEGYEVVSGWRKDRKDPKISRNLVSAVANKLISAISGVRLHDYGCTLKAYRKIVLEGMRLYGEMHRFLPIYASWMGARITEIDVRHHQRQHGDSHYGLERIPKVLMDLAVTLFLAKYLVKPIYVFGTFGALCLAGSFGTVLFMLYLKFFAGTSMIQTPLPVLASMFFLVGTMSFMMGLLAEMLTRTYFESRGRPPYDIKDTVNLPGAD